MSSEHRNSTDTPRDADLVGAEAAMHRAARRACQRAEESAKRANVSVPSQEKPREVRNARAVLDPETLTFSQAQGYEELPGRLRLEELPHEARVHIWNAFYLSLKKSLNRRRQVVGTWAAILASKHLFHDIRPADELSPEFGAICKELRDCIYTLPLNGVFDLIQFVLRRPSCPPEFSATMKRVFSRSRLAYTIDEGNPVTIVPAVTPEEGNAVIEALQTLGKAGLGAGASHLRNASECINAGDWAGSVRESMNAVESVARKLDPKASGRLGPALAALERCGELHPRLKVAFDKLYAYTSAEQGVRHALLDRTDDNVGMDEAVFMLGACASFASYLWRKHVANQPLKRALTVPSAQ